MTAQAISSRFNPRFVLLTGLIFTIAAATIMGIFLAWPIVVMAIGVCSFFEKNLRLGFAFFLSGLVGLASVGIWFFYYHQLTTFQAQKVIIPYVLGLIVCFAVVFMAGQGFRQSQNRGL